jgi:hypothetical protein
MKRYNDYIKRTALDYEYREECARKAEYYKLWNNQTAKYSEWTGPQYYELRYAMNTYIRCLYNNAERLILADYVCTYSLANTVNWGEMCTLLSFLNFEC